MSADHEGQEEEEGLRTYSRLWGDVHNAMHMVFRLAAFLLASASLASFQRPGNEALLLPLRRHFSFAAESRPLRQLIDRLRRFPIEYTGS